MTDNEYSWLTLLSDSDLVLNKIDAENVGNAGLVNEIKREFSRRRAFSEALRKNFKEAKDET